MALTCKRTAILALTAAMLTAAGCNVGVKPDEALHKLAEPFPFQALQFTPILATSVGYHEHVEMTAGEKSDAATKIQLDVLLDDFSPEGIQNRIKFNKDTLTQLEEIDRDQLRKDDFVDYLVIEKQLKKELFELEKVRSHEHNPTMYVELIGQALYAPMMLEYAPAEVRYGHIIERLEKLPAFLDQAKQNLKSSPAIWTSVAKEENDGNIQLVARTIPASLPSSLQGRYGIASEKALAALRDFNTYLTGDLANRADHDWRLGSALYAEKFKLYISDTQTPDQALADAEAALKETFDKTVEAAKPLHRKIYGGQRPPTDYALMTDVLAVVNDENKISSGDFIGQARKDIDEARAFIQQSELCPLPAQDKLQIVDTPEFMRGIYSVAGFVPAPPLEPNLGAFYWVTPIPSDWPRTRVISKLLEYNRFALKLLTMHEAIPGHYTQFELSNTNEVPWRRVLRTVFADGPYVEGWATYITDEAIQAGFGGSSDELKLNANKIRLRAITNTILDIKMHTQNMSDDEATELLRRQALQEAEEASGKVLRAKLSSAQLPMYWVGHQGWLKVRNHYQTIKQDYSLSSFHGKALIAGPMPFPALGYLLAEQPMQ